jgi:transcriptional regulator with XRE-family HTH domain
MRHALAAVRESRNMTQTEVSKRAAISQGYYSDIESGQRCPSPEVAVRVAKVLGIPQNETFDVFYGSGAQSKGCFPGKGG